MERLELLMTICFERASGDIRIVIAVPLPVLRTLGHDLCVREDPVPTAFDGIGRSPGSVRTLG
jgi:hypothetical protein